MTISVVGVDLSKSVFQLSIADGKHRVVDRKRLSRAQFHRFFAQSVPCPYQKLNPEPNSSPGYSSGNANEKKLAQLGYRLSGHCGIF